MLSKNIRDIGDYSPYHRGALTNSPTGSQSFSDFIEGIESAFNYEVGYIPAGAAHRPDLISNVFYGTPAYWWLILLANNVPDPFEGLNEGDQILIPVI